MKISDEQLENGICKVSLAGRLDSMTAPEVEGQLLPLADKPGADLLLDLSALEYISSAGLRVVLMAAKRLRAGKGRFRLCGMSDHVRQVFEISGFLGILTVCDDCEQAISEGMTE
ncbi:MAG: STAS domain-containing protein [Pseudomonadota bacterium]